MVRFFFYGCLFVMIATLSPATMAQSQAPKSTYQKATVAPTPPIIQKPEAPPYEIRKGVRNVRRNQLYRAWNAWYSDPYRTEFLRGPEEAYRLGLITRMPPKVVPYVPEPAPKATTKAAKQPGTKPASGAIGGVTGTGGVGGVIGGVGQSKP